MRRIAAGALAAVGFVSVLVRAQPPATEKDAPKFEVASVKPSQSTDGPAGIRPAPGGERYLASRVTLKLLITVAYRARADQVSGGPDWIGSDLYDMNAKAERPSSVEELHLMLQDLLGERFKLRFHRETREMAIYALVVDKDGPKLKPHDARNAGDPWIDATFNPFPHATWHAQSASMDYFAWRLSTTLDRPSWTKPISRAAMISICRSQPTCRPGHNPARC